MVEIRVAVADDATVHGLMRRFVALFGRAAVSFDVAYNEVPVSSAINSDNVCLKEMP